MKKKEKIKEDIIEAGKRVFTHYGMKKTTMNDVAKELNKGKSTLYYYFKTKEELFSSVIEKEMAGFNDKIQIAVDKETDPKKKLEAYLVTRLTYIVNLTIYFLLKDERVENFDLIQKTMKEYDDGHISIIKGILKEGIRKKTFLVKNLDLTAYAVHSQIKSLEYPLAFQMDTGSLIDIAKNLMDVLFYGITKR